MSTPPARPEGMPEEIVPVRLRPPTQVFEKRAARFAELAPGDAAGEYLAFLAHLAEAQRLACRSIPVALGKAPSSPSTPLHVLKWPRDGAWRDGLRLIRSEMGKAPLPEAARSALARLGAKTPEELEAAADGLLCSADAGRDAGTALFVGAALQVYWTGVAARVPVERVERPKSGCPVCGSPPVAAIVQGDGLRYLTCSLCAAEWHLPRVVCATCRSTARLSYCTVEGDPGTVKAEACEECGTYLKLFYPERGPRAEPLADDLATLPLDLLMAEEGYARGGVNLFLLPGPAS